MQATSNVQGSEAATKLEKGSPRHVHMGKILLDIDQTDNSLRSRLRRNMILIKINKFYVSQ